MLLESIVRLVSWNSTLETSAPITNGRKWKDLNPNAPQILGSSTIMQLSIYKYMQAKRFVNRLKRE